MSDLDDLSLFAAVVKHGSMSAAGRALNMPKATLSRRLAALEHDLGTQLIRRSTRAHVLTDAGRRLHTRIAPLVVEAERAVAEVRDAAKAPSGLVRLAASAAFGKIVLMPILTRFVREYSKVRLDLTLSDQRVHLVEAGFDLAIRMGALDDSDLLSRQLTRVTRRLVASPDYLSAHGTPRNLDDLHAHSAVVVSPALDVWRFDRAGESIEIRMPWRMATGDMPALSEAAKQGIGLALLPAFLADPSLQDGTLVAIDVGAEPVASQATIIFPRSKIPSLATRHLIDFISRQIALQDALN